MTSEIYKMVFVYRLAIPTATGQSIGIMIPDETKPFQHRFLTLLTIGLDGINE